MLARDKYCSLFVGESLTKKKVLKPNKTFLSLMLTVEKLEHLSLADIFSQV
jgi:hypothetical protein